MRSLQSIMFIVPMLLLSGTAYAKNSTTEMDTLYQYDIGYYDSFLTTSIVSSQEELDSFLKRTGYDSNKVVRAPVTRPDFSKVTIFAFAGWPCSIMSFSEDNNRTIIQYRKDYQNTDPAKGYKYARPLDVVMIYAIPRTYKTVVFIENSDK